MQTYSLYTLIDITETNIINSKSKDVKAYNQKQNLNTCIQLAGLRSQPVSYKLTRLNAQDLVNYHFGNAFRGLHTVWILVFVVEHADVYMYNDNPVHFLQTDFDGVAFTPYLDETVNFLSSSFETYDLNKINIYFKKI